MTDYNSSSSDEEFRPNWDDFSFEDELKARKLNSDLIINELRAAIQATNHNDCIVEVNQLSNYTENVKPKNMDYIENIDNLKLKLKKLKEEFNDLKDESFKLEAELKDLEGETTSKEEYKLYKEAYSIALTTYSEYFGFQVHVQPLSEDSYEASIKFRQSKHQPPIKVIVNRKEKKIMEFDCDKLLTQEEIDILSENQDLLHNFPRFFAKLRHYVNNKNIP